MTPHQNLRNEWPPLGARARDWAEVQEGQCAAAYHAVLKHAGVGSGASHLYVGR